MLVSRLNLEPHSSPEGQVRAICRQLQQCWGKSGVGLKMGIPDPSAVIHSFLPSCIWWALRAEQLPQGLAREDRAEG